MNATTSNVISIAAYIANTNRREAAAQAHAEAVAALPSNPLYSHLLPVGDRYCGNGTSKNIKRHLAHLYPGVKFSVRQNGSNTHSSILVCYTGGPSAREVETELSLFTAGDFDGGTDCYRYNRSAFNDVFGSVQYLSASRKPSPNDPPVCRCYLQDDAPSDEHRDTCPAYLPAEVLRMREVWL